MNSIVENFSSAFRPVELVVTDQNSILRADAEVDADAARKSEGRWFNHSNLQPTGRYARTDTQLNVIVSPSLSGLELVIGLFGIYGEHNGGVQKSHARFALNPGANVIVAPLDGMIYIQNRIFNTVATVEVSGGEPVPTYIKGVTTNADFRAQVDRWKTAPFVELIGDYVMGDFQSRGVLPWILDIDLDRRIGVFDAVVAHTNVLYGLSKHAHGVAHKSSNRIYISNPDSGPGFASATDGRITFQVNTGAGRAILMNPENNLWGLYHEVGHTYQPYEVRWSSMTEVSVNISSLAVQEALGFPNALDDTPTRNAVAEFRKTPIADRDYASISNVWLKLLMLDQLRRGFGGNFYAQLAQQFRTENSAGIPEPETALGIQRHFMLTSGKVANRNLTRFFEEWGMPLDDATRSELAKLPALKYEIWNNMNRPTDVIERTVPPLLVPATLTSPARGASFCESHAPLYEGKGTPGATVTIEQGRLDGAWYPVGTTTVRASGDWSFQGLALPAGNREARATLSNEGTGFARNPFTVTELEAIEVTMTSPAEGALFGEDHVPIYSGKGTPGATVRIDEGPRTGAWRRVGTATVNDSGDWFLIGSPLTADAREARATQGDDDTDFAKNRFTVSEIVEIPPTLTFPAEGVSFNEDHRPVYAGKGTPGATVTIEQGLRTAPWRLVGAAIVNTNGDWSYVGMKLSAGEREARATQSKGGTGAVRNRFTVTIQ
ncbi:hypothetical protein EMIT0196MI5_80054 [Pseudomonas sp. IT-196MI5]|uniref:M60 family metallopeptidase n=1 Tax=Pseudomonas sp. IT-196MI5 TaxID=3026440 RepID=UPI0039DFB290